MTTQNENGKRSWQDTNLLVVRDGKIGPGRKKILEKKFKSIGAKVLTFEQKSHGYNKTLWPDNLSLIVAEPPDVKTVKPILEKYFVNVPSEVESLIQSNEVAKGKDGPAFHVKPKEKEMVLASVDAEACNKGKDDVHKKTQGAITTRNNLADFFKGGSKSLPCQRPSILDHKNKSIVKMFKEMTEYERVNLDNPDYHNKVTAYCKIAAVLRAWPIELKTSEDVNLIRKVPRLGAAAADKIKEALREISAGNEATCMKLRAYRENQKLKCMREFVSVHGIGEHKADAMYKKGMRTLEDLRSYLKKDDPSETNKIHFNEFTKQFLKHYNDVKRPFSREDVEEVMERYIGPTLKTNGLRYEIVGGYRRGKEGGHDLDILITDNIPKARNAEEEKIPVVDAIVWEKIEAESAGIFDAADSVSNDLKHFIICSERTSFSGHGSKSRVLLLLCRFENVVRRIDLVFVPSYQWPFALLGWSGSQEFEKSIRYYAAKFFTDSHLQHEGLEWRLSSNSLSLVRKDGKAVQYAICKTEEDIFKFLGLKYLPPSQRCA